MTAHDREGAIRIRPATPNDVPQILRFIRELAEYERLADQVSATEEIVSEALFGARPAAEALIAELGETAIGYACYFTNFSSFLGRGGLYIEDIYVQPAFRGRGVGLQLMARVARLATERQCGRLEWAVLDWNRPSIDFYERLGARAMSEWTVYRVTGAELDALAARAQPMT